MYLGLCKRESFKRSKSFKNYATVITALEKQKANRRRPRFQVLPFDKMVSVPFYSSGSTTVLQQDCATTA